MDEVLNWTMRKYCKIEILRAGFENYFQKEFTEEGSGMDFTLS